MKFCMSSRVSKKTLQKADEIFVRYEDIDKIPDLNREFPEKTIILETNKDYETIRDKIIKTNKLARGKLICFVELYYEDGPKYALDNIKFFYKHPVVTFLQLRTYMEQGACRAIISPPLTHMLPSLKKVGIPIMMYANISNPLGNGDIYGGWVRPDDIDIYEEYIHSMMFLAPNPVHEEALYRVYAENKYWGGKVGDLIYDLNCENTMSLVPRDLTLSRIKCAQRCMITKTCHLCDNYLKLANKEKIKDYLGEKKHGG